MLELFFTEKFNHEPIDFVSRLDIFEQLVQDIDLNKQKPAPDITLAQHDSKVEQNHNGSDFPYDLLIKEYYQLGKDLSYYQDKICLSVAGFIIIPLWIFYIYNMPDEHMVLKVLFHATILSVLTIGMIIGVDCFLNKKWIRSFYMNKKNKALEDRWITLGKLKTHLFNLFILIYCLHKLLQNIRAKSYLLFLSPDYIE
jgi:hypothetical protein